MTEERKGECQGRREKCTLGEQCPKFGTLGRPARDGARRIKGCGDPVARGKRNRAKGSDKPGHNVAGSVSVAQIRAIAESKMKDLNANSVEAAMSIILGSAKSCGLEIKG